MTPEQQRIAIAEVCGWKNVNRYGGFVPTEQRQAWEPWKVINPEENSNTHKLPDFLNDLNAIHAAESILRAHSANYVNFLETVVAKTQWATTKDWNLTHATAAQRAEAFLRATGKWAEQPVFQHIQP